MLAPRHLLAPLRPLLSLLAPSVKSLWDWDCDPPIFKFPHPIHIGSYISQYPILTTHFQIPPHPPILLTSFCSSKSNFSFLSDVWKEIRSDATEAEKHAITAPVTSAFYARLSLERTVNWLYDNDSDLELPYQSNLSTLMGEEKFRALVPRDIWFEIDKVKREGNNAAHGRKINHHAAVSSLRFLHRFLWWFAGMYGEEAPVFAAFDESFIPRVGSGRKTAAEMQALQQQYDEQQAQLNEEREKRLKSEAELAKLKAELERIQQLKASHADRVIPPPPFTEEDTRRIFIDILLSEAGWDPAAPNATEVEVTGMPLEVNPTGVGYVDYVLWGSNGLPLAVVEAKKTGRSPETGRTQAALYAGCLEKKHHQRPVIYYTNGYEIWLWDDTFYPERKVQGFHTRDELQLMVDRRSTRRDLRAAQVNLKIADRAYQLETVSRVAEAYATDDHGTLRGRKRAALVVMATGAGKTRTAAAIVDILVRCNWVKRVLFLADRNALVAQAKANFLRDLPHLTSVDLTNERPDDSTRLVFSTYQTIMNRIDQSRTSDFRYYGVGHFDLIIVDEAHRSVYEKYRAIFTYFDALMLGLTATPRAESDRDTYQLFGCEEHNPTAWYELDQAVAEGFLVPPKGKPVDLGFMKRGIRYADLSEADKKKYEETFRDEAGNMQAEINAAAINNWLFNANTIDKVIDHLMREGIRVEGGDKIGKSIIFARSHQHAEAIKKRFDIQYPEKGGAFLQIIDNYDKYAQATLGTFSAPDRMPQIAVSVDMLDTGIDIPEIVNLVFFKPVFSSAKFWQMIGRGTRLCRDLFGPGLHKDKFYIFDFCGNFDFFGVNPEGIETATPRSLSHRIFETRLYLAEELRQPAFSATHTAGEPAEPPHGIALRIHLLDLSHHCVQVLWEQRDSFRVRPVIHLVDRFRHRSAWDNLTLAEVADMVELLGPLIEIPDPDEKAKRFDLLMYSLMLALVKHEPAVQRFVTRLTGAADGLLRIANIPAVLNRLPSIRLVHELAETPAFWQDEYDLTVLETLRRELRGIMHLVRAEAGKTVYTDFEDEVLAVHEEIEVVKGISRMSGYKLRVERFIRENRHHLTIRKLHTNQPITASELEELERLLFDGDERGTREDLVRETGSDKPLGFFIRSILGLDVQAAQAAFTTFLTRSNLRADQITFIRNIISHLTQNGVIEKSMLAEWPFTEIHDYGVFGVFEEEDVDRIIGIIERVNGNAVA